MSTDIYLAAAFFDRSSLGPFHLSLSSSVFMGIFQSVTFSLLLIIQQSFLITSFPPKWKLNGFNRKNIDLSLLHLCRVSPQLSNTIWKWRRKLESRNKLSQSWPAWYFKILSSHWILLLVADLQVVKNTHPVSNLAWQNSKHLSVCLEVPSVLVISLSFGPEETHFSAPIPED